MKEVKISKQGTMTLPKELRDSFKGSALLVESDNDVIVLRKTRKISFTEMENKLRVLGKEITSQEVEGEIRAVRSKDK